MLRLEKFLLKLFKKYYQYVFLFIVTIIAIYIRFCLIDYASGDMNSFLMPWATDMKSNGGLKALANYPGDYGAPYMTLLVLVTSLPIRQIYAIKGLSFAFDFLMAIGAALLVRELVPRHKNVYGVAAYAITLFIPSVILNSAAWGQCDALYVAPILFALYFLIKKKYVRSFVLLGIAFAFKLQAIFILPLFIIYYVCEEKYSILYFLLIPIVNIAMCIPALCFGMPFGKIFGVYFHYIEAYPYQVLGLPNLYQFLNTDSIGFAIFLTLFAFALMLFYCIHKKVKFDGKKILVLALWSAVVMPFLLPEMHERYWYLAEVLGIIYLLVCHEQWGIVTLLTVSEVVVYSNYLYGGTDFTSKIVIAIAIAFVFAIFKFSIYTISILGDKNISKKDEDTSRVGLGKI